MFPVGAHAHQGIAKKAPQSPGNAGARALTVTPPNLKGTHPRRRSGVNGVVVAQSRIGLFRRRRLHEPSRELLFSHSPRGNWPASPYRWPLPSGLFTRDCLARRSSPRFEWRAISHDRFGCAGAPCVTAVEGVLAEGGVNSIT